MRSILALSFVSMLASACGSSATAPTAPSSASRASVPNEAPAGFGVIATQSRLETVPSASLGACLAGTERAGCVFEAGTAPASGAPPGAPASLTGSANGGVVTLSWSPAPSDDPLATYIVEAGSTPGASNLASLPTGNANPGLVTGGVPPGTYYVRVRAATVLAIGPPSNEVTLVVGGGTGGCVGPPAAPTNLAIAANTSGRVVLTWAASSSPGVSYIVQVGSSPGASNLLQTNTAAMTITANAVVAGSYYVRVRAQSTCGTSAASNEVTVVVGGGAVPNASVAGVWDVTASPGPFRPFSRFTVTITQSGSTLRGTILPVGQTRSTQLLGDVRGSAVRFGSETAWWNDVINGRPDIGDDFYFNMTLDATGRTMTGNCSDPCGVATATRR
jgi:hypothetical protein